MKITVEGIGILEYGEDGFWGKIPVNIFSNNYEIDIHFKMYDDENDSPSAEMIMAAKNCLNAFHHEKDKILQAIMEYYTTEVRERADEGFCDYIEIDNPTLLSQIMEPVEFYVDNLYDSELVQDIQVGICFECDWNEEGFAIKFDGTGNILETGTSEIIY